MLGIWSVILEAGGGGQRPCHINIKSTNIKHLLEMYQGMTRNLFFGEELTFSFSSLKPEVSKIDPRCPQMASSVAFI